MKVLHIGKYFPPRYGGIETFMSQLMEEQASQGLKVSAIVHADNLQSENGCYQWNGCNIFEVKSYGQLIFAPVAPSYPLRLSRVLAQIKPDILHIHMPNLSAFWILILNPIYARQAKIVIHWHSDVLGASPTKLVRLFYPLYRVLEKWLLSKANKIIATSRPYLSTSIPLKACQGKTDVVPLGIKTDTHEDETSECSKEELLKLVMVGRLSYYKGHLQVLNALSILSRNGVNFHLDVIGNGEYFNALGDKTNELNLTEHVTWHGSVEENCKNRMLKCSDLLLLPSIERTEAFGVVLLEAAAFKVPALVSDVCGSGMSHVVQHLKTGLVVANNNIDDLADKLDYAAKNKLVLKSYGLNAFERLKNCFDIQVVSRQIVDIYHCISGGKPL